MKKVISVVLSAFMMIISFTAVHCEDNVKVTLDGKEIAFDVPPQIIDGRTLVPMRAIFEALGAKIYWNDETQTVEGIKEWPFAYVKMQIGNNVINIMRSRSDVAEDITLDVPPQIIGERTLVPVRAVSESLDCDVLWDGDSKTVIITSNKTAASPPPSDIPIAYDDTEERKAHYMRDFEILSCVKNADGDYVITYKLRTFLEGRGTVPVTFGCYDENGSMVDSFGNGFVGTDYTWSWHEDTATISGKTAKIELILNK